MSTVLIISDSHGLTEELVEIKKRHQPDYMIHCGDSELDLDAEQLEDFYKVRGNCDTDNRYPDELVIELDGLTFFLVHGHLHQVKRDLTHCLMLQKKQERLSYVLDILMLLVP